MTNRIKAILIILTLNLYSVIYGGDISMPPHQGEVPIDGMVVDNYETGLFAGGYHDKKGSSVDLKLGKYTTNGPWGHQYLSMQYNKTSGGYVGLWHKADRDWQSSLQNWREATEFVFMAKASQVTNLTFTFKTATSEYQAHTTIDSKEWKKISLPTKDWKNIGAGLGVVTDFNIDVHAPVGYGEICLDELRMIGAKKSSATPNQPIPSEIFKISRQYSPERSNKQYVVDTNHSEASNSNLGTHRKPFKTIAHAARVVKPGDTVWVKSGYYREEAQKVVSGVLINKGGAPDAWVRFKAWPGDRPKVNSKTWSTFNLTNVAFVEVSGFDITTIPLSGQSNPDHNRNTGNGITVKNSHHIILNNNILHDCGGGGIATAFSDYIWIEGNISYNNAFRSIYNSSGISLFKVLDFDSGRYGWNLPYYEGFHNVIRRNISYRNENKGPTPLYGGKLTDGNGIIIDFTYGKGKILIEDNIVFDNGGRGIHLFHGHHALVRNNTSLFNCRTEDSDADFRSAASNDISWIDNIIMARPGETFDRSYKQGHDVDYSKNIFVNFDHISEDIIWANNWITAYLNFVRVPTEKFDGKQTIQLSDFDFRLKNSKIHRGYRPSATDLTQKVSHNKIIKNID